MPDEENQPNLVTTSIRFPEDVWEAGRIVAVKERTTYNAIVVKAVDAYCKRFDAAAKNKSEAS